MEKAKEFLISAKYAFILLLTGFRFLFLEGPSATAKTTMLLVLFFRLVRMSDYKLHVIAGLDLGVIEKNLIDRDFGILEVQGLYDENENPEGVLYFPHGKGNIGIPHIWLKGYDGKDKIVLLAGYKDTSRWKKILGGQYGITYIDEMVHADLAFVRQIFMRSDVVLGSSNPDDPDLPIYKEYINKCRPLPQTEAGAPPELIAMLNEPAEKGWLWGYCGLDDNIGLPEEKKQRIIKSHTPGTADYMHYIEGRRGRADGVIFDNFDNKFVLTKAQLIQKVYFSNVQYEKDKKPDERFVIFSSGLDTAFSPNSNDTIAMTFIGITNKRNIYVLDEEIYNNKGSKEVYAPSTIAKKYYNFLEKNRLEYGLAQNVFIDSADQATIQEIKIQKQKNGWIYNFNNAYKKLQIIERIKIQKGWIATENFYVLNNCQEHLKELKVYSWDSSQNKTVPEDKNDHTINSVQYAWIPYKDKIGIILEGK